MSRLFEELENRMRGLVRRMKVTSIDDSGEMQTASGMVLNSEHRSNVEIMQMHGFSSKAPPGSLVAIVAVGGDQGDLIGLPIAAPGSRMGNLKAGESVMYGLGGSRVHMKADGSIDIQTSFKVTMKASELNLTGDLKVTGNTTLTGNVDMNGGSVKAKGVVIDDTHTHVSAPSGPPGIPSR